MHIKGFKRAALLIAIAALVSLCGGCAWIESMLNDGPSATPEGVVYPDFEDDGFGTLGEVVEFTLPDFDGVDVSLSDYAGKVVVLNFWASWCEPSVEELPAMQTLWDEYESSGDAVMLMINLCDGKLETEEAARSFMSAEGYTFRALLDENEKVGAAYNIYAVPTTVVIGADGEVYMRYEGITDSEDVKRWVDEAK